MLFSIIVPIYNVEKFLPRCVRSLTNQTYKDIQIILVDDGGNDRCPELCDEYARNDSRIQVVHKKNGGLSDARNAGLIIAKGDYIIFVDSDDYIEIDTCERIAKRIDQSHPDIIIGGAIVEGGGSSLHHPIFKGTMSGKEYLLEAYRMSQAPMAAWLNIYRRSFLSQNDLHFKYGILHEDEQFTPRAFLLAQNVICLDYCFYHYIIRGNSITTKKDRRKNANDLYTTCCELEKIYRQITNQELRDYLLDSLCEKYLYMYQIGALWRYGTEYYHKHFIYKNAKTKKSKLKASLYCLSPKLYYFINNMSKISVVKNEKFEQKRS